MSFKINVIAPGIFSIPGFLDDQQCSTVIDEIADRTWQKAFISLYRADELIERKLNLEERDVEVLRLPFHFNNICPSFSDRLHTAVTEAYNLNNFTISGFVLSKYVSGSHIREHSDTGVNSTKRLVTCVQYFNDEYSGGQLLFPRFDISYRPNKGELILFYSEYSHAVKQIISGIRYCMVSFVNSKNILKLPKFY